MAVPLEHKTVFSSQFADDQTGDKEVLEYAARKLKETYGEGGLTVNIKKPPSSYIWGMRLTIYNQTTKTTPYLGVTFDKTGTDNKEIRTGITQARKVQVV